MRSMEAVILAGGMGTRLRSVVRQVPKPMADINGRPFLSYILHNLTTCGVGRVFLSVGYMHEVIEGYFGKRYEGLDLEYVVEDKPLGTGGAIKTALKRAGGGEIIVLNGDTFFAIDLLEMLDVHRSLHPLLTMAIKPLKNIDRYGTVIIQGGLVKSFEEKTHKEHGYINGGVYIVDGEILEYLEEHEESFSFETDFLQKRIDGIRCASYISDAYFIDIGVPDDYMRAQVELRKYWKG